MCSRFRSRRFRLQGKMSSRFLNVTSAVAIAAVLALSSQAASAQTFAQSDDADLEMRIQRLENQLRQLTGQNEELQYRNRQLEERLRQLGGASRRTPGGPASGRPARRRRRSAGAARCTGSTAAADSRAIGQPQPGYPAQPQGAISRRSQRPRRSCRSRRSRPAAGRRRGDAFDPSQNPNAPGAPRALGGGQLPIANEAAGRRSRRPRSRRAARSRQHQPA